MALDTDTLLAKTTAQLKELRSDYVLARKGINSAHSSRGVMLPHDRRRCNDVIKLIDSILRKRAQSHKALKEFE